MPVVHSWAARSLLLPLAGFAGMACILLWAATAEAQSETNPNATAVEDSVVSRPRPEYDPIGLSPGLLLTGGQEPHGHGVAGLFDTFLLFPSMGVETYSTDNVFQTSVRRADQTTLFQPGLELRSDWENHEFKLGASATAARERRNPSANSTDYEVHASTRLDIVDDMTSNLVLSHKQAHETNSILVSTVGQGTFNQGTKPVLFQDDSATIDWSYQPSVIQTHFDAKARHLYFDNLQPSNAAQLTIESNQNRWEYDSHLRVGYEAFEGTVLFVEPGLSLRRYDRSFTDFPQLAGATEDRNSNGDQLLVGLTYNASSVTFLDFGVGYIERRFRNPNLPRIDGVAARGALTWNPTDLVTIGASVNRDIVESTGFGIAGFFRNAARLSVDYEYDYNKILSASLDYASETAVARLGFDQKIKDFRSEVSAAYLINEYAKAKIGYRFEDLTNSTVGQSFRENQIFLRFDLFY